MFVGVDVGGTKILAGAFGPDLTPLACVKTSTQASRGPQAVLNRVVRSVAAVLAEAEADLTQVRGIGVGIPGSIDPASGHVILAVNLGWKDVPVREPLARALGVPVFVENDANVALLGIHEHELRAAPQNVVGVFMGTGIGGALLLNGDLFTGHRHAAGEIGHMIIDLNGPRCSCGRQGCFEALASRNAIFREIRRGVSKGRKTVLTDILGKDLEDLRSGHLRKAIRRGDKLVRDLVHRAAEYTAIALSNVVLLYDPELIVLGGGLIEALGYEMLPIIQRLTGELLPKGSPEPPEIIATGLADNAGIVGAAVFARNRTANFQPGP